MFKFAKLHIKNKKLEKENYRLSSDNRHWGIVYHELENECEKLQEKLSAANNSRNFSDKQNRMIYDGLELLNKDLMQDSRKAQNQDPLYQGMYDKEMNDVVELQKKFDIKNN